MTIKTKMTNDYYQCIDMDVRASGRSVGSRTYQKCEDVLHVSYRDDDESLQTCSSKEPIRSGKLRGD